MTPRTNPAPSGYVYSLPPTLEFPIGSGPETSPDLAAEIRAYWEAESLISPHLFDGGILSAVRMTESLGGRPQVHLRPMLFSHYHFGQSHQLPSENMCRSVAVNAIPKTNDNYYVVARMGRSSSFQGRIKFIGGAASGDDIRDGRFLPLCCLAREFAEETGLELAAIATKITRTLLTTRPGFNIFNVSHQLELGIDKATLLDSADFTTDESTGGHGEISELVFLEATDSGLADFERDFGAQCLDYVLPLLRVLRGQEPVRTLTAEMFT